MSDSVKLHRVEKGEVIREQRYHYVSEWDEVTRGFAYIYLDLEVKPDEIWTYRDHLGEPSNPPQGWKQVCPSCSTTQEPDARFCPSCGVRCHQEKAQIVPFNRTWGYWLDCGHDWSWRREGERTYARINNAGASQPGFWLVLNFYGERTTPPV